MGSEASPGSVPSGTLAHRVAARRMGVWIASVAMYYAIVLATAPRAKLTATTVLASLLLAGALLALLLVLCRRVGQGRSVGAAMAWAAGYAGLGTVTVAGMMATQTLYRNAPVIAAAWGVQVLAAVWAILALRRARPLDASS